MALAFGAEALVSIKRIEQFLLMQEKEETSIGLERKTSIILLDKARKFYYLKKSKKGKDHYYYRDLTLNILPRKCNGAE